MSKASHCILLITPEASLVTELQDREFEIEHTSDAACGTELMSTRTFAAVLLDLSLPSGSGLDYFVKAHALAPHTPFLVVVEPGNEKSGRDALHLGAQDYVLRNQYRGAELAVAIRKAIERHHAQDDSRRDRRLLEILMNKIPDAIYFKDTESRFVRINQAHAKRFNLSNPALAIGKTDADFFSAAHAQQALADEQQAMRTGQPLVGIEEAETWPDGSVTWVSSTKMPLRDANGKTLGTFGISRDITARKKAELALAERTRQLQQKNEQIAEELRMARELQLAMLPQKFPCLPPHLPYHESALEFFSFYLPNGSVSGDFYDVVELSDTSVGIFICDVMGHDVRAALITAMMRSLVQDLSHAAADPGKLLAQINRALAGVFKLSGTTMFATALYLIADVEKGELRYASAAHPDALYVRRSEGIVESLGGPTHCKGPALGLFDEAQFPKCVRSLGVGDLLLLFTDGLIEAEGKDKECFDLERLIASVRQRAQMATPDLFKELIAEIQQFSGKNEFTDDVSVLGVGVKRLGPPPHNSCPVEVPVMQEAVK
jgi:sigma-B regulation protein RsbU (phosphoserine phosphatase)